MVIHVYEWYGYFTRRRFTPWGGTLPESTYFFTVGLHAAHVTTGLGVMAYLIIKAKKGGFSKDNYTGSRELRDLLGLRRPRLGLRLPAVLSI